MSRTLLSLFIITLLFGGSYFWYTASATCPIPLTYRIASLDPSFGLSEDEARAALADAESLWEDGTGLNLFSYDEAGRIAINFVFDERQQFTDAEKALNRELERTRAVNAVMEVQYQELVARYSALNEGYQSERAALERALNRYNEEVEEWNDEGGAPQEVYDRLNEEKERLDREQKALNDMREELQSLVTELNALSDDANAVIERYNEGVSTYNHTFSEGAEFTQGDYRGGEINIYQFDERDELIIVLAHEFGHALGVGHVENKESIMYSRMGAQQVAQGLTNEDVAGFVAQCGDGSTLSKLRFW